MVFIKEDLNSELSFFQMNIEKYRNSYLDIKYFYALENITNEELKIIKALFYSSFTDYLTQHEKSVDINLINPNLEYLNGFVTLSVFYTLKNKEQHSKTIDKLSNIIYKFFLNISQEKNDNFKDLSFVKTISRMELNQGLINISRYKEKLADLGYLELYKTIMNRFIKSKKYLYYIGSKRVNPQTLNYLPSHSCSTTNHSFNGTKESIFYDSSNNNENYEVNRFSGKFDNSVFVKFSAGNNLSIQNIAEKLIFNALLAQFPGSPLYKIIREEKLLAYKIKSNFDYLKGSIFIEAHSEISNLNIITDIILNKVEEISKGEVAERELVYCTSVLINYIYLGLDNPQIFINFHFHQHLLGNSFHVGELIDYIKSFSLRDCKSFSKDIKVDLINYFYNQQDLEYSKGTT